MIKIRNIDDPINVPIFKQIEDLESYNIILNRAYQDAQYLNGYPIDKLKFLYSINAWHPMMSKVRYGLLCISLKNPKFQKYYDEFCAIYYNHGPDFGLKDFKNHPNLLSAIELISIELKKSAQQGDAVEPNLP